MPLAAKKTLAPPPVAAAAAAAVVVVVQNSYLKHLAIYRYLHSSTVSYTLDFMYTWLYFYLYICVVVMLGLGLALGVVALCCHFLALLFTRATRSIARYMLRQRGWLAGWLGVCHMPV